MPCSLSLPSLSLQDDADWLDAVVEADEDEDRARFLPLPVFPFFDLPPSAASKRLEMTESDESLSPSESQTKNKVKACTRRL